MIEKHTVLKDSVFLWVCNFRFDSASCANMVKTEIGGRYENSDY